MDPAARKVLRIARKRNADKSICPMLSLPTETKMRIMSRISTQESLSRLAQSCRAWHKLANKELYKRDAKENRSFAIKEMAHHAVDEQTTDSAIRTLAISLRWKGEIDTDQRKRPYRSGQPRLYHVLRMYDESTALHFSIILGNLRLTEALLNAGASTKTDSTPVLYEALGSEEFMDRNQHFQDILEEPGSIIGGMYPLSLAFLHGNADMCKLLVDHGADRTAGIVFSRGAMRHMSVLHFAAADRTTDYRQWQYLFDKFRRYIDERCPRGSRCTPLHVALINGCTQGMQLAVEFGANKEAKNGESRTPLAVGILKIPRQTIDDPKRFEEHMMCLRKFVDLGGSVNPEGDSLLALAMQVYAGGPSERPHMRQLIYFLLEHNADVHGTILKPRTNVVNELINGIIFDKDNTESQELLKELFGDLVDKGLNLTKPAPGLSSPLRRVLKSRAEPNWLFDFLCENGATIHDDEVDSAFLSWCSIPRLWSTNEYNAWWQHQGQEDEIFMKWCEHLHNAWWWKHVKQISPSAVSQAYQIASNDSGQLHDILTHLPLSAPSVSS